MIYLYYFILIYLLGVIVSLAYQCYISYPYINKYSLGFIIKGALLSWVYIIFIIIMLFYDPPNINE